MKVSIFIPCYNESEIIKDTVKHYRTQFPSCSITIYDNFSTDNSVEIAKSLNCTVIKWNTNNKIDDYKLKDLKNNCWKSVKDGWIIMADMDEWLCITEEQLIIEDSRGTTILTTKGFNMVGGSNSIDLEDIKLQYVNKAVYSISYDKSLCFKRSKIQDINYAFGAHECNPTGQINYSKNKYIIKHMCFLGLPYLIHKMKMKFQRSHDMRQNGLAVHYTNNVDIITKRYTDNDKHDRLIHISRFYKMQKNKSIPKKELKFIHITKTAGTSIEDEGLPHERRWGRHHAEYGWWHELFPRKSPELRKKYDWFMIVRNPYTRILSEFHYIFKDIKTKDKFNKTIHSCLKYLLSNKDSYNHPYQRVGGDHFTEQHKYLDNSSTIHVLYFENIKREFEELMNVYDYNNIRLKMTKFKSDKLFEIRDITEENIIQINTIYKNDFEKFGYKIMNYDTIQTIEEIDTHLTSCNMYSDEIKHDEIKHDEIIENETPNYNNLLHVISDITPNVATENKDIDTFQIPENKIILEDDETIDSVQPPENESVIQYLPIPQPIGTIIRKNLRFIHISRTAGTSIEQIGLDNQHYWGRYHREYGQYDEVFTNKHTMLKISHDWFTVVRNPYTRILSEYNYLSIVLKIKDSKNPQIFNSFIKKWIENIENDKENHSLFGKIGGGHFTPQYKYIDNTATIHILKYEKIEEEFNALMTSYEYNMKLNKKVNVSNTHFRINDISEENIKLIDRVYKNDFEIFGYTLLQQPNEQIDNSVINTASVKKTPRYAIVFLTITPSEYLINVANSLERLNYTIFICADSNIYTSDNKTKNIHIIQYPNQECYKHGYKNSSFIIKPNGVIAWDKALYHFCVNDTSYDYVWFIEDDVFLPTNYVISDIDTKYPSADVLSSAETINTNGELHWHWKQASGNIPLPWMKALVCAVRLSKSVLSLVNTYVKKYNKLLFIELFFHTLALHNKLIIKDIPELSGIIYKKHWSFTDTRLDTLYHPIKDTNKQKLFAEFNNRIIHINNNGHQMNKLLKFIHITQTCGEFIEEIGFRHNICWGKYDKEYGHMHEIFIRKPNELRQKYEWFTVVRNPYTRIIAEYSWLQSILNNPMNKKKEFFNSFIKNWITNVKHGNNNHPIFGNKYGDHFTEQWKYIDNTSKIYVIKYENIKEGFDKLMSTFEANDLKLDISLHKPVQLFTIHDINQYNIKLIKEVYAKDFELFHYSTELPI